MATVKNILDTARSQLGYTESPANSNNTKYGKWYGTNYVAWCAMFVSWVFDQNHALDILFGKDNYTVTMAKRFYNAKQWGKTPKPGAVVFFNFGNPTYGGRWMGIHHVGIVESVRADGRIVTIEGNTSAGDSGSQSNGGGVFRRVRAMSQVAGFGYPKYAAEVVAPPVQRKFRYILCTQGDQAKATAEAHRRGLSTHDPVFTSATLIHADEAKTADLTKWLAANGIHGYTFETTQDSWKIFKGLFSRMTRGAFHWHLLNTKGKTDAVKTAMAKLGLSVYAFGTTGLVMIHARPERSDAVIAELTQLGFGDLDGCKLPTPVGFADSRINRF